MGVTETTAEYLRIAAISVATYEFFLTIPAEYRFYSRQSRWTRPSLACLLFFAIRYSSVATIVVSNVGQFATFSETACNHYFLGAPALKVVQTIICQIILFVRTYAISKRSRTIAVVVGGSFFLFSVGEAFCSIYKRIPSYNADGNHHCTSGNEPGETVAWIHYLLSMCYDLLTLTISSYYLLGRQPCAYLSFSGVSRVLLVDGLGYFVMLTGVNIVNMIFYKTTSTAIQSAMSSFGYTITMIGGQRILIHLRELADPSYDRTPRRALTNGQPGSDGTSAHEMAIRITIEKDVEAYSDAPDAKKSFDSLPAGRAGGSLKDPTSFAQFWESSSAESDGLAH